MRASKFAALIILSAALVALVATRRIILIEWSSSDTPGFLQQLFSGQIAIATLIATGISIVVQLRSSRFGSDVLFNLVWSRWFVASTVAVVFSVSFTGALLGNWRSVSRFHAGLIPDLVVLVVVISTSALLRSAISRLRIVTDDESVARYIAAQTRHKPWPEEIRKSSEPRPIRWLAEALMAARSSGDIQLFNRLLSCWVREISKDRPYEQVGKEASSVVLSGADTDYMVALDRAHRELLVRLSLGTETRREFSQQFAWLAELAFPAFSKDSEHHLRRPRPFVGGVRPVSYQAVIPGLYTLGEMTSQAIATEDFAFASTLIRDHWGPAAAAAVRLSERIIDWTNYEVADRALTDSVRFILRSYVETAPNSGKKVVREAVSVAMLKTLAEAESTNALDTFAAEFSSDVREANVEESFGEEIARPWLWQAFLRVADKEHAPVVPLCRIASDAVRTLGKPENFFKLQWVRDEIFLYLHGVLRAVNRNETWQFMEEPMVECLWKYLEGYHTRKLSVLDSVSTWLDDGPFYTSFKERYDLSCEVLTDKGQEKLRMLKDDFVSRYQQAKSANAPE